MHYSINSGWSILAVIGICLVGILAYYLIKDILEKQYWKGVVRGLDSIEFVKSSTRYNEEGHMYFSGDAHEKEMLFDDLQRIHDKQKDLEEWILKQKEVQSTERDAEMFMNSVGYIQDKK